jgi:hypothetical protein
MGATSLLNVIRISPRSFPRLVHPPTNRQAVSGTSAKTEDVSNLLILTLPRDRHGILTLIFVVMEPVRKMAAVLRDIFEEL